MAGAAPQLPVYWHDSFTEYRWPDGTYYLPASEYLAASEAHPECPERVENVRHILEQCLADHIAWEPVAPATDDDLELLHERSYLETIAGYVADPGRITGDTWVDGATVTAAHAAAGAAIQAGQRAIESPSGVVPYALVRPSGHHVQSDRADGLCLFNNAALAAEHALAEGGVDRVAVVDWDVHHGNGTQELFYDRDDVLVVSLHGDHGSWDPETHPQSGRPEEDGAGDGTGYTVNVPLPAGTGDAGYAAAFESIVEPVVGEYDPDLLVVSAGQDPGLLDPQGRNLVTKAGFEDMGQRARTLADRHADGSLAVVQEGGYQQSHLPFATLGVLEGALGADAGVEDPFLGWTDHRCPVEEALTAVADHYASHWPVLSA